MKSKTDHWKVLLIGGGSSVGKTSLAETVARATGAEMISSDDLRQGTAEELLAQPETWDAAPEQILLSLRAAADELAPVLRSVVRQALEAGQSTVIEGERITPAFAAERSQGVAALFLVEEDEGARRRNLEAKSGRFRRLARTRQRNVVRTDWLYGQTTGSLDSDLPQRGRSRSDVNTHCQHARCKGMMAIKLANARHTPVATAEAGRGARRTTAS